MPSKKEPVNAYDYIGSGSVPQLPEAGVAPEPIGPTAADVNNAAPVPRNRADFLARGGLSNTAMNVMQKIQRRQQWNTMKKRFEQILAMGEKGADAVYNDAINTYGPEVQPWIPKKEFFFDAQTGQFMPYQYAKAVYVGVQKFKEDKATRDAQERQQQGRMEAAPIIAGARNAQEAAAGLLATGQDLKDYSPILNEFPSQESPLQQAKTAAEIGLARSQTIKNLRPPAAKPTKDDVFESIKKEQAGKEDRLLRVRAEIRDVQKAINEADKTMQDTSELRTRLADLKTEETSSVADLAATKAAHTELARTRSTEARRAAWSGIESGIIQPTVQKIKKIEDQSSQDQLPVTEEDRRFIAEQSGANNPVLSNEVMNRYKGGVSPGVNSEGDPEAIEAIKGNSKLWAKYQAADPISKAKMRKKARDSINAQTSR